jgi:hypothetical protein
MYRYRLGHFGVSYMMLNVQSKALEIKKIILRYLLLASQAGGIKLHYELWEGPTPVSALIHAKCV